MRTTLTLDDDVAALLQKALRRRGATLKGVVNEALRRGLLADQGARRRKPYRTRSVRLGAPRIALDNVADAIALAEGEHHR